jgi:hypothetical protein
MYQEPGFVIEENKDGTAVGVFLGTVFARINDFLLMARGMIYFSKTFFFRDTYGLPLTFIFDRLQKLADERKMPVSPCLRQFSSDALSAGWGERRIIADVREAFGEIYGQESAEKMMEEWKQVVFQPKPLQNLESEESA